MDMYGYERRHNYMEQPDMIDFLDPNDMFHAHLAGFPAPDNEGFEQDWLNSFLDDPVLNDKMMTDAMQPPLIKSEHSYSISDTQPVSPLHLQNQEDMDSQLFSNNTALDLTMKPAASTSTASCEIATPDAFLTVTTTAPTFSFHRQPAIIVTTASSSAAAVDTAASFYTSEGISFPTIQIKNEAVDYLEQTPEQIATLESIILPPTPPGSSGSESDTSQSPHLSAPSSPSGLGLYRHSSSLASICESSFTQPLYINPLSQSGVLILSEEEKRTLVSEGYPIPTKLPLTKQEEKNLKKIRRKIKNKISAQESRRKKKEYLEALEKRVEAYNHENNDLKKKVEHLENNNRSLLGQLQKLQSLVGNMPKGATATQTSTALMVLVFCFAAFLGTRSLPSTLNIGYVASTSVSGFTQEEAPVIPREAEVEATVARDDPYKIPHSVKSRMLMSIDPGDQCDDFRSVPWENAMLCPQSETKPKHNEKLPDPGVDLLGGANIPAEPKAMPDTLVVMVVSASMDNNHSNTQGVMADKYGHRTVLPEVRFVSKEALKQKPIRNVSTEMGKS